MISCDSQHVYRQATAVHRAASAFNTGLRGEEQYSQGMSGVGPMSPPPFPMDNRSVPASPVGPPDPPQEALYGAGHSPRQQQSPYDDNPNYSGYDIPHNPQSFQHSPSNLSHQYSAQHNGTAHTSTRSVNVNQSPAMQAIINSTQIIFQAADPAGIGKLSKDMAYRVLDMVWGRSTAGTPDESGPRGVLRLSFDRAFDQQPEVSVEEFISILTKVGAPPPYRSQELEYAIITSAKYLQADEESSLDWRALFLPVIILGLSAFNAGFALDVCWKAIPKYIRDYGSCKDVGSVDFKRITDDAYGFDAIFIHNSVRLVIVSIHMATCGHHHVPEKYIYTIVFI